MHHMKYFYNNSLRRAGIYSIKRRIFSAFVAYTVITALVGFYDAVRPFEKVIYANETVSHTVIPSGEAIGLKLYSGGLIVTETNRSLKLKEGDIITEINGTAVQSAEDFSALLNAANGSAVLGIERNGKRMERECTGTYDSSLGRFVLGITVKDSAAGIGTMTYIDPENMTFGCLGHGISESETGTLINAANGTAVVCRITGKYKAKNGETGSLGGVFSSTEIGSVALNSDMGVYGTINAEPDISAAVPVASKYDIQEGAAYILATIDDTGVQTFDIEIKKVNTSAKNNRGLTIKVTDERLIEATGGIVQGMSGAPIIQNGTLVGAVTHVFVNDPTKGYGIFAEYMLENSNKIR